MPHAEGPHIPGIPQALWPQGGAASRGPPEPACAANVERSRLISGDPQDGHSALAGSSPARTSTSDFFSQAAQRYSRRGMGGLREERTPERNKIRAMRLGRRSHVNPPAQNAYLDHERGKMLKTIVRILPVIALAAAAPALAITAEEIVAKNVEARGGAAALSSVMSLRRTGRFVLPGQNILITQTEVKARPGRIREEATYQGLTQIQAWDGEKGWQVQPFEGRKEASLMSEDDAKPFRLAADLDGAFVDAKAKGHVLEYLGTEDVDGTLAHKLRVRLKWGGELTVWIDPDTWMVIRDLQKSVVRGAEQEVETDYGDYEKVGGVFLPMSEESGPRNSPPSSRAKSEYDKAEVSVAVSPDAFAFPVRIAAPAGEGR
jgi:outer membrane lipoprotein-sorting protein